MHNFLKDLESLLYSDIVRRKKTTPFIILVCFIVTFVMARAIVKFFPGFAFVWNQYHIHHFYYGILALAIAGWIALVSNRENLHTFAAVCLGLGLGLVADEFGLMLTCASPLKECDYLARQSYDLAIILFLAILNAIYFVPFWKRVKWPFSKLAGIVRAKKP
jgi:hypothetical protein